MLGDDTPLPGGSSPHTRGARGAGPSGPVSTRIIPAYAGSTRGRGTCLSPTWDHPRIRGEHAVGYSRLQRRNGIIPAYAGSTTQSPWRRRGEEDHPRIRGEHKIAQKGKGMAAWIIPAYAGSTRSRGI